MSKALAVIIEHFYEKRWIFLIFGILIGLMGILVTMLVDQLDIATIATVLESFPEELLEFFGGMTALTTPYGFVNIELFTFMWIFVGIFLVYMASSTALPAEVEDKTIDMILSKPISRSSYLMGKITFLYLFIAGLMAVVLAFIGVGMATSQTFIDF
ncbi:MAG: ABC transporter permease subunit, partial [Candidatus Thorarchaeota archaeon]|nr:ABC transporter permease subunit [Candidatus Thorarchaeota archaeon]